MISIVVPVFNEEKNILILFKEIKLSIKKLSEKTELIFVNDGSTDKSETVLNQLKKDHNFVKVINLSKNFGQTPAIAAGIDMANGDSIIIMDGDLQNDPRDILKIYKIFKDKEYDCVAGYRKNRKDSFFQKVLISKIANYFISKIIGNKIFDAGCSLKIFKSKLIENMTIHGEMHRLLLVFFFLKTQNIFQIEVNHRSRVHGNSNYGLGRIFKVFLDVIFIIFCQKFLSKPMYFFGIFFVSLFSISILSFLLALFFRYNLNIPFMNTPLPIMIFFFLISSFLFLFLGIISELLVKILISKDSSLQYFKKD